MQGYTLANMTHPGRLPFFVCVPYNATIWQQYKAQILATTITGGVMLLVTLLFLSCIRKGVRPAFMQQFVNLQKRVKVGGCLYACTSDCMQYALVLPRWILSERAFAFRRIAIANSNATEAYKNTIESSLEIYREKGTLCRSDA